MATSTPDDYLVDPVQAVTPRAERPVEEITPADYLIEHLQAATTHAELVVKAIKNEEPEEEVKRILHAQQKSLADTIWNALLPSGSLVWVNTYLRAGLKDQDVRSFAAADPLRDPSRYFLYKAAAVHGDQKKVDHVHFQIEEKLRTINEGRRPGETVAEKSLTYFLNHEANLIIAGFRPCSGSLHSNAFLASTDAAPYEWYLPVLFQNGLPCGYYVHLAYPNRQHLPNFGEAGVYLMFDAERSWYALQAVLYPVFNSFLLQITSAHLLRVVNHLRIEHEQTARMFLSVKDPVERLAKDVASLESHARRIRQVLLPPERELLDTLNRASIFFQAPPSKPITVGGAQYIKSHHNVVEFNSYNEQRKRREQEFIAAVLLTILGYGRESVSRDEDLPEVAAHHLWHNPDEVQKIARILRNTLALPETRGDFQWDGFYSEEADLDNLFEVLKGLCHTPFKPGATSCDLGLVYAILSLQVSRKPHPVSLDTPGDPCLFVQGLRWFLVPENYQDFNPRVRVEAATPNANAERNLATLTLTRIDGTFDPVRNGEQIKKLVWAAATKPDGGRASDLSQPSDDAKTALWEWATAPFQKTFSSTGYGDWVGGFLLLFGDLGTKLQYTQDTGKHTFVASGQAQSNKKVTLTVQACQVGINERSVRIQYERDLPDTSARGGAN